MRGLAVIGRAVGFVASIVTVAFAAIAQDVQTIPHEAAGTAMIVTGDLLEVQGYRVRLAGIDAPEPGQVCRLPHRDYDCGRIAATALMDLTAGASVRCTLHQEVDDGIFEGSCTADGYDLSEGMTYTGWALARPGEGGRYRSVEAGARIAGRGLWRGQFVKPWDWRRGMRLEGRR